MTEVTPSPTENHAIPPAEVVIEAATVRGLLERQHPDLAALPLRIVAEGWDNVMVRIGNALCARLPRRSVAVDLLLAEQALLPRLAPVLPLPVPAPVRTGVADTGFGWPWSVVPWLRGGPVGTRTLAPGCGAQLGAFLKVLHRQPLDGVGRSAVRGCPLQDRDDRVRARLERLAATHRDLVLATSAHWQAALAVGRATQSVLLHGDLHPRNVLADAGGQLSAVIDWGDVCCGDAATDLAVLWLLLPNAVERAAFCAVYPADRALLARAAGWAVNLGSILLETGIGSDREQAAQGALILERLAQTAVL